MHVVRSIYIKFLYINILFFYSETMAERRNAPQGRWQQKRQ